MGWTQPPQLSGLVWNHLRLNARQQSLAKLECWRSWNLKLLLCTQDESHITNFYWNFTNQISMYLTKIWEEMSQIWSMSSAFELSLVRWMQAHTYQHDSTDLECPRLYAKQDYEEKALCKARTGEIIAMFCFLSTIRNWKLFLFTQRGPLSTLTHNNTHSQITN
jgi:hypothetical protein